VSSSKSAATERSACSSAKEPTELTTPGRTKKRIEKKIVVKKKIAIPTDCRAYKECICIKPALSIEYFLFLLFKNVMLTYIVTEILVRALKIKNQK